MEPIKAGDIVGRKSYNCDILFVVKEIEGGSANNTAQLKGLYSRIWADAPLKDLVKVNKDLYDKEQGKTEHAVRKRLARIAGTHSPASDKARGGSVFSFKSKQRGKGHPVRVLHIDADADCLKDCMKYYKEYSLNAKGHNCIEREIPFAAPILVERFSPDIVVLTGHDSLIKGASDRLDIKSYKNSSYYVEAVRALRKIDPDKDSLVIFAGACQSYYEALIDAGANFASSPQRVLIHAYDPLLLAVKVAFTSIGDTARPRDAVRVTITGTPGLGGVETRGKLRNQFPGA